MKHLSIDGDNWFIIDQSKPHLKPKEVANNPFRYWHYPINECKNITIGDFWSRCRENNTLGRICRSFGLSSSTYFNNYSRTVLPKGQLILQQDQGQYICNPNINTPNFNPDDIEDFNLILDPNDRSGNPIIWTLDRVCKNAIIKVWGGDENCII